MQAQIRILNQKSTRPNLMISLVKLLASFWIKSRPQGAARWQSRRRARMTSAKTKCAAPATQTIRECKNQQRAKRLPKIKTANGYPNNFPKSQKKRSQITPNNSIIAKFNKKRACNRAALAHMRILKAQAKAIPKIRPRNCSLRPSNRRFRENLCWFKVNKNECLSLIIRLKSLKMKVLINWLRLKLIMKPNLNKANNLG